MAQSRTAGLRCTPATGGRRRWDLGWHDRSPARHPDPRLRLRRRHGPCARRRDARLRAAAPSPPSWGPPGSGKSTLLQTAAGLDRPTSGRVHLGEVEVSALGERALARLRRERLGFVFQSFNLLGALTAAQNVALPSRLAGRQLSAAGGGGAGRGRARGARRPPPGAALGRPAAAGGDRARAGRRAGAAVRGRADRRAGPAAPGARCSRCCATPSTAAGARSSWSPTTRAPPPTPIASSSWPTAGSPASCTPRRAEQVAERMTGLGE